MRPCIRISSIINADSRIDSMQYFMFRVRLVSKRPYHKQMQLISTIGKAFDAIVCIFEWIYIYIYIAHRTCDSGMKCIVNLF